MIGIYSHFRRNENHNPWLFNAVLWTVSFAILLFSFTENNPRKIDYIYTCCFVMTLIVPCLINLYLLVPRFLKHEKHALYILCFFANLVFFTQLNILFFQYVIDFLFPEYYFISYHSSTELIVIFGIFLITTTLLKLSEDWFYFNKIENRNLKLKNQQIKTQLSYLKSQINPHFLFNSLNVVYALVIEKKEDAKDAIVKLSDILRYVIYDSNTVHVTLKDEMTLLRNYIEFQKLRQLKSTKINLRETVENNEYKIYPMLLLPLVENSFKHGFGSNLKESYLNISIYQKSDIFQFEIENNYQEKDKEHLDEPSGLGLANIKENLDIVYPGNYDFEITNVENKFKVSLKLVSNDH